MKIKDMKNKTILFIAAGLMSLGATSCSKWLDVKMEDRIMENTLYSTNAGYMIALNGIYLQLNNIYTSTLGAGIIDVMAQYYNVTENDNHAYKIYSGYKYDDVAFESQSGSLWQTMYSTLANINVLIEHCDDEGSPLLPEYYPVIKGEALALRAMLHFDLLRLYGPIYDETTASTVCIPWQPNSSREIQPMLPASEVLSKVINDLEEAEALLRTGDPIHTVGVGVITPEDNGIANNDMYFRQLRLNYYAVKGLLARAYQWKGDRKKTYQLAKEILEQQEAASVFNWASKDSYLQSGKQDFMFSSEVIFAIYNSSRINMYNSLFNESLNAATARLAFYGESMVGDSKVATFYDDDNDWRRLMWAVANPEDNDDETATAATSLYFTKYQDFASDAKYSSSDIYRYMVPLVRLSEIYLMVAECTDDPDEAIECINEIRRHRECMDTSLDAGELSDLILKEFAREMIGEGQLFFYYKRHAMEEMISGTSAFDVYSMVTSNYVWPIPKVETDKRLKDIK